MDNLHKFIATDEDWYPAYRPFNEEEEKKYPGSRAMADPTHRNLLGVNAVRVSAIYLRPYNYGEKKYKGCWKISVWGNDDFGLEKEGLSMDEAKTLFDSLDTSFKIKQSNLKKLGFLSG